MRLLCTYEPDVEAFLELCVSMQERLYHFWLIVCTYDSTVEAFLELSMQTLPTHYCWILSMLI
jgi:hypothetical protein